MMGTRLGVGGAFYVGGGAGWPRCRDWATVNGRWLEDWVGKVVEGKACGRKSALGGDAARGWLASRRCLPAALVAS